jgi:hypothetical protein
MAGSRMEKQLVELEEILVFNFYGNGNHAGGNLKRYRIGINF